MIIRDVRQAGFKYFEDDMVNTDEPIRIVKDRGGVDSDNDSPCDHISIVFGDVSYDANGNEVYERYRVKYYCKPSEIEGPDGIAINTWAIYKQKEKLGGSPLDWRTNIAGSYPEEYITDYVEDLIFIPKDINGEIIDPPPRNDNSSLRIFDIRAIEIGLTTRSINDFYNETTMANGQPRTIFELEGDTANAINDLFLRETIVMSVNTRNIGLE